MTAPVAKGNEGLGLGLGGVQPMPPDAVRPDTVDNGADLICPGESDSDSDGFGDAMFTPVNKSSKVEHGWSEGGAESDEDMLLSSFHGDELDDLNKDWPVEVDLDTNLGTDFLSLFAPSPTPQK